MRGAYVFSSLHLIEAAGEIGRGLAYGTDCPQHLLNSRAVMMSVTDDRADFINWIAARDGTEPAFPRREVYGEYVAERFNDALRRCGRYVHVVRGRAVEVTEGLAGATVKLDNGDRLAADVVVLATGHQAPASPAIVEEAGLDEETFIRNPWSAGAYRHVRNDEDVLLLGTGMTSIDAILALSQRDRRGRIYALSRRGISPRAHAPTKRKGVPILLPERLSEALSQLRWQAHVAEAHGRSWRDTIDELRPFISEIWQSLTPTAKRRFLRHARPYWDAHRHKLPPAVADRLEELKRSGALTVLAGKITGVSPSNQQVRIDYRPRGAEETSALRVARILNCTGPNPDLRASTDPLYKALFSTGLARPHETGIGLDVSDAGALIDVTGAPSSRIYALGPVTQGAFWECVAAPEIRARAISIARRVATPDWVSAAAQPRYQHPLTVGSSF
jgi:uncharacterized NAD(P)/FAD-binding protein YdhS